MPHGDRYRDHRRSRTRTPTVDAARGGYRVENDGRFLPLELVHGFRRARQGYARRFLTTVRCTAAQRSGISLRDTRIVSPRRFVQVTPRRRGPFTISATCSASSGALFWFPSWTTG